MDRRIGKCVLIGALALAAGSTGALAQQGPRMGGSPSRKIRPDVVVSTVGSGFTKYGTVGTITGYAVTTVSCNVTTTTGDDAIWLAPSNNHPLIAQNAFRLKDGKFEQIGMSWLKHAWCAADAPNCGSPYGGNGSCDWLGRFATDTYGADLNADQTDLGPRSEVNPWTTTYPYPYLLHWNQTGNAIFKRMQIDNSDLNPSLNPGALYFVEVVYLATDEWPEQRFNNGSWRRFNVGSLSGGGYNLSFTGSTTWQNYGIQAWKANDATVTITNVDTGHDGSATGGDGRFIVGSKVTDNGNGTWTYEYAIYNANNAHGGGAFSLPLSCMAQVTNVGFHDVPYHSDEPFNSVDWTATTGGGKVRWATAQTFDQNVNANALRWGSLYNFRLTTNTPPVDKTATIEYFKPLAGGGNLTFTVSGPSDPPCIANWNHDAATNSTDVSDFINDWFDDQSNGTFSTDVNCDGACNSTDVSDFINIWFEALDSGCV